MRVVPATWMPGSNQRRHRDVIGIRLDGHPAICLRTERAAHPGSIDHSHSALECPSAREGHSNAECVPPLRRNPDSIDATGVTTIANL